MLAKVLLLLLQLTISYGANPGENAKSVARKQIENIKADSVKQAADVLKTGEQVFNYVSQIIISQSVESLQETGKEARNRIKETAKSYLELDMANYTPYKFFDCISTQHYNATKKIDQLLGEYVQKLYKIHGEFHSLTLRSFEDIKLLNDSIEGAFRGVLNSLNNCKTSDCERNAVAQARKVSNTIKKHLEVPIESINQGRFTLSGKQAETFFEGFTKMKSARYTAINIMDDCNFKYTKALPQDSSS